MCFIPFLFLLFVSFSPFSFSSLNLYIYIPICFFVFVFFRWSFLSFFFFFFKLLVYCLIFTPHHLDIYLQWCAGWRGGRGGRVEEFNPSKLLVCFSFDSHDAVLGGGVLLGSPYRHGPGHFLGFSTIIVGVRLLRPGPFSVGASWGG